MAVSLHDDRYELVSRVSDNGFTESWRARDRETGRTVFVKIPSESSELDRDFICETLRVSAREQAALPLRLTISRFALFDDRTGCRVYYPWLDHVTPYPAYLDSVERVRSAMLEVAFITDYLHGLGLVHRDLKLSNFVEVRRGAVRFLALADLDLLTRSNVPCGQKIFGTPGMIAPEITGNQLFTTQADVYSLGRSLAVFSREHPELAPEPGWSELVARLTDENPITRPKYVLETMHACSLVSSEDLQQAHRRLLGVTLFSRFKQTPGRRPGWVLRFVKDQNRVFGFPDELLDDLERAMANHPGRSLRAFRLLLGRGQASRASDFWFLKITDDALGEAYRLLGRTLSVEYASAATQVAHSVLPGVPYLMHEQPLKRLLSIKEQLGPGAAEATVSLREEAGDLAMTLGRSKEAAEHYRAALSQVSDRRHRLGLLRKLMFQYVILSELDHARELIDEAMSLARQLADNEALLDLRRQQAWFMVAEGLLDKAGALLTALEEEAETQGMDFVLIRCLVTRLYLNNKIQRTDEGMRVAERILALSERAGHPEYGYSARISQFGELLVRSQFRKADLLAEQVQRLKMPPHFKYANLWYCLNRHSISTRLGDYDKASYWLHRSLDEADAEQPDYVFRRYFTALAWMQVDEGKLAEAEQNALRVLSFDTLESGPQYLGPAYQILCNACMRMGRREDAERYGSIASTYFDSVGWPAYFEEIQLLRDLNRLHNSSEEPDWEALLERQARLFELRALYYAVVLTFHVLLYADDHRVQVAIRQFDRGTDGLADNEFPLLEATRLLALGRSEDLRQRVPFSKALKGAVRVLERINENFLCLLLCERIGTLVGTEVSHRRARGYLETALTYARALPNPAAEKRILQAVDRLGSGGDIRQKMLESMLSISQIFSDGSDYESALTRLLRFAVDESGAERGALYLVSAQTGQLLLRASVDCDEASLKDIEGISSGLLARARANPEPKIISDARSDRDLQQYQSVVANNIRSVATVPMFAGGTLRGFLYMDHHTVPARFDDADLMYVRTIAFFLGAMLDSIDHQRAVTARVEMLDDERRQLGKSVSLVAEDPAMLTLLKELAQIACTNASILLRGESGTGKELIVEMIHRQSHRADKPLVKVNCAAIPEDLMEVELFGIRGGTASNVTDREGKFEHADGGTLFLDEIGDMSWKIQAAVLRCLEYQRFERVGSHRTIHTDIRFIYATNKNLEEMVERGTFRLDLYHRIKTIDLVVPPLRERPDDILPLIEHFGRLFRNAKTPPLRFTDEALAAVMAHTWPGNVRELRNVVERLSVLLRDGVVRLQDLPDSLRQSAAARPGARQRFSPEETALRIRVKELGLDLRWLEPELESARRPGHLGLSAFELLEREVVRIVLKGNRGNISKTARTLDYAVATLRRRIKKYRLNLNL